VLAVRGYRLVKRETATILLQPKAAAGGFYLVTTSPDGALVCT
jgi:hypothetical protein